MAIFVLIPLFPLLASLILVLGGRRWNGQSHQIGIPAIGLSFALSVFAFLEVLTNGPFTVSLYRLFQSGSLTIDINLFVDQLTVLLLLLVTGVSGVVHVYSSRYMIGDPHYNRFFSVIALFTFSMILLVMSGNLLMLLVSWEVMGLCSYLLISHASQRKSACHAATKAFLVNAVSDIGLSFGIILAFYTYGTLDIQTIVAQAESMQDHTINILGWMGLDFSIDPATLISFFLFVGAMGKSAQIPFHVWLPFAMEAPTPVSALIHAATMVNAGPFLLVRLSPLIALSPFVMMFIAFVGAITAVFAGVVSLTQSDIKKILAYSTISQIGFMVMACGLGAFVVAIFHLLAHGCYKAFFFLSTGNALRSVEPGHAHTPSEHHPQQGMGMLYGGAFLLALIPPLVLFSGSYEYLWGVTGFASATIGFKIIGLITVFIASMYIFRDVASLFVHGPKTYWPAEGSNVLATQSIRPKFVNSSTLTGLFVATLLVAGIMTLLWSWFANFLAPALTFPGTSYTNVFAESELPVWLFIALGVAVAGWVFAYLMLVRYQDKVTELELGKTRLYVLFWNKFYFDEIYDVYLVSPTIRFAHWLWRVIDISVVDRFVHSIASHAVFGAQWLWRIVDMKGIDRVVTGIGEQSVGMGRWLPRMADVRWVEQKIGPVEKQADAGGQTVRETEDPTLQHQLLVMILWLVLAIGLLYILV